MSKVTLETTEGVLLSIEEYNDLQLRARLLEELLTPDQFGEGAIDYPTEHPDRCKKLDNTYYDPPIIESGKSRLHWRCHKKMGHIGWCSSHNDCGAKVWSNEIVAMATCGESPGHDNGVHNVELGDVSKNPKRGDKVSNRKQPKHQTRQVEDRTLYGDVIYFYDVRAGYEAQCTLAEWKVFCAGATLLKASPNVK